MSGSHLRVPPRWLECPRKSDGLIGDKFLAIKTPLSNKYDSEVPPQNRYYPSMVFQSMRSYNVKIGLWIDLTNTSRFYDKREIEKEDCKYLKLNCKGHGETPSPEVVNTFVQICDNFIKQNPLDIIVVHCTHGFNRTGFVITSYFVMKHDWSPEAGIAAFAKSRTPGIYKQDYINELFYRFGDQDDAPQVPQLPAWCFEAETGVDEDGQPLPEASPSSRKRGKAGTFMEGVSGVEPFVEQPGLAEIQSKINQMCGYRKSGFPGSQPVSMSRENMILLSQLQYKVSWKADGTRYMMLVLGFGKVYLIDRDNCVYKVNNLNLLHRKDPNRHLQDTLLDGELVIDQVHDRRIPRYLIYDIIRFEGDDVGGTIFSTRAFCIQKEIIQARNKYIQEGKIDREAEPFGLRHKEFWPLDKTRNLLGPKFTKESLGHEPDGLIFQPSKEAAIPRYQGMTYTGFKAFGWPCS